VEDRTQILAAELLSVLRAKLCSAEEEVTRLRGQIKAVEPLASTSTTPMPAPTPTPIPTPDLSPKCDELAAPAKPEFRTVLLRAKNTADLVIMFLHEHPGAMVSELHALMVKEGLSVGQPEYFYTVIKKLEKKGLVRRDPNSPLRGGRYFAVNPQSNLVLQSHRQGVTQ
jgi:hypothetical protein